MPVEILFIYAHVRTGRGGVGGRKKIVIARQQTAIKNAIHTNL